MLTLTVPIDTKGGKQGRMGRWFPSDRQEEVHVRSVVFSLGGKTAQIDILIRGIIATGLVLTVALKVQSLARKKRDDS